MVTVAGGASGRREGVEGGGGGGGRVNGKGGEKEGLEEEREVPRGKGKTLLSMYIFCFFRHYPVGVLYDLYGRGGRLPWTIAVHFKVSVWDRRRVSVIYSMSSMGWGN